MTRGRDPQTCRRALREIGEIAAVATLPGSLMTDQEAVETIAGIAEWADAGSSSNPSGCDDLVRRVHEITASLRPETLDDHEATTLFEEVLALLKTSYAAAATA